VRKLWQGRDAAPYERLVEATQTMPGIEEFFGELDRFRDTRGERVPRAIIGGGCYDVAARIAKRFGVGFVFANQLVIKDGKVTGEFHWPVGGSYTKRQIIEQLCDDFDILPQDVLMIGDSDGDIDAFRIVGTSIAFNCSSPRLKEAATYAVDSSDLRDLVPVLEKIRSEQPAMGADTPKI
jgi:phosphoserine phosphatase